MRVIVVCAMLALIACREDRPPAPTAEDAAQLNEMESALNDMARNEKGPEADASGPSNASD